MKDVRQKIATGIKSRLLMNGFLLNRTVDPGLLKDFFSRIKPVTTNHELIRLGGDADGGYLVPNDLENIEFCFSPGVDKVADFELALVQRGIKCFLADYSVERPPIRNEFIDFEKKFLGLSEGETFITLENWVRRKAPGTGDLILQMDIEDGEYDVIFDTGNDTLRRFRILLIEFHRLDKLIEPGFFKFINLTFAKLLKTFEVVHIHPNNYNSPRGHKGFQIPPIVEFTFLRKDRVHSKRPSHSFPHPLDRRNVLNKPDYPLPDCWYRQP